MSKKLITFGVLLLSVMLVLAACGAPTPAALTQAPATAQPTQAPAKPTEPPKPTDVPKPTEVPMVVPNMDAFLASGHADATAMAFNDWNEATPPEVPTACARCHASAGFHEFITTGKVAAGIPAPAGAFECETCHNAAASELMSVTFPSGKVINTSEEGEALCMTCHQGRESKVSVDKQIANFKVTDDVDKVVSEPVVTNGVTSTFGFRNIHYFAAGATLYGSEAQGGYEYDGKMYDPKFRHVDEMDTCVACHDQHATQIRIEKCQECHTDVKTVDDLKNIRMMGSTGDYNGNGDVKEGIAAELKGLQDILYSSIQMYANEVVKTPIAYDPAAYPYWFTAGPDGQPAKDDKGNAINYNGKWTARLLKAAYNYQLSVKDPGAFAHNAKYVVELLNDSIADLNDKISKPVDMTKLARDDAPHFAGNTMPFRDWDSEDSTVPYRCAKCHSATGLPEFLKSGGTIAVTGNGTTLTTGIGPQHSANGFMCTTCHDAENFPERYTVASVVFPSGKTVSFGGKDDKGAFVADEANLCILCHQGRESTLSMNNALKGKEDDTVDKAISFKNVHYLGAGATLFGNDVQGAYQYADKQYDGQLQHPLGKCTDCHDVHTQAVKTDACKACHGDKAPEDIRMVATDWDGDGNTTEGVKGEIDTLAETLYAEIQKYAETTSKTPIVYDGSTNPYFFVDANKDGKADTDDTGAAIRYNAWTPRLLRAAYNYQYAQKDPGVFVHNPQYVIQFLIDSIGDLGGNVSGYTRPEVPAAK
jgi:hypothetical protein